MKVRNSDIVKHIENYCLDIETTVKRFGKDKAVFESDVDYRNQQVIKKNA